MHNTIITPVLSETLNMENVEREKNKKWISWEQNKLYRRNKKTFFVIFKRLSLGKI